MNAIFANPKTSLAGITMILTGLVHIIFAAKAHALTEADCTTTLISIVTGVGLIAAGDAKAQPPTPPPPAPPATPNGGDTSPLHEHS